MKTGSRIFNRILNRRFFASYLDRGREWREWRWLREESRKGFSLQEVLLINNIPDSTLLSILDRCIEIVEDKTIEDKILDKETERDDIGDTKQSS